LSHKLVLPLSNIFETRGGVPRFNQMLCLALDQLSPVLDLDVTVLSQDDALEHYEEAGRPWQHARFIPGHGQRGLALRTLRHCAAERPDLMLLGLLGMTPLGLLNRPWLRRGYGFIAHGVECWNEPRLSRRFSARRAAFAFAVSRDTQRQLAQATGIDHDTVHWLPNTLDPTFDVPAGDDPPPAEQGLELITVARLWAEERKKGVDHTLEALARLKDRHPQARFRIVGKGTDKPRLEELARSLGIADRVVFHQDIPDDELAGYYKRCALFVLPSGQEGFGIVFLEAMRFAKPCIGGNVGGTPEVVEDEQTGLLVPFGDVDALERGLDRLLSDGDLRRRMGIAGRKRLLTHFVFDRFRERLEGYLRELLK